MTFDLRAGEAKKGKGGTWRVPIYNDANDGEFVCNLPGGVKGFKTKEEAEKNAADFLTPDRAKFVSHAEYNAALKERNQAEKSLADMTKARDAVTERVVKLESRRGMVIMISFLIGAGLIGLACWFAKSGGVA